MNIEAIKNRFDNGFYTYINTDTNGRVKLPKDYVFDEELSVKRNRELRDEYNLKVDKLRQEMREKQEALNKQLADDVVQYIKENYELDDKQASMVERWVWVEYHHSMTAYFSNIDCVAEFAQQLVST